MLDPSVMKHQEAVAVVHDPALAPAEKQVERAVGQAPSTLPPAPAGTGTTILKVRSVSRTGAVAGAIAGLMRQHGVAEVQVIGAGAANQAVKAIALARSYLQDGGAEVCFVPGFFDVVIDGQERTGLYLHVQSLPAPGEAQPGARRHETDGEPSQG